MTGVLNYLVTDYGRQLDFSKSLQNTVNIKRLSLKRRPRAADGNAEKTQSGISSGQWHSAESLSSFSNDDTRLLGRPPLPPPHGSTADKHSSRNDGPDRSGELKSSPAARAPSLQKQNPLLEQTIAEQHLHLEQESTSNSLGIRRRLASFGGVSSPGSLSRFTGLGAYDDNNKGGKASGISSDTDGRLGSSLGGRGSTGCLRSSPQGSGRSTPVSSLGPTQLLNVRDQMVVALEKLRELEEQVKIIPLLKVKISVLQEEKRQLASQLKIQYKEGSTEEELQVKEKRDGYDFNDRDEEMLALERAIKTGHYPTWQGRSRCHGNDKTLEEEAMNEHSHTSIAPQVQLGRSLELEAEIQTQQQVIAALTQKTVHLEAHLKESSLQAEMSRLKLELQAAEARNRVDKASSARPSTASCSTEARPDTKSQGVGNHTELKDAGTGDAIQVKSVAVSCCGPELKNVCIGPDLAMSRWEVRERAETREKGVGVHVSTNSQGVGVEVKLNDAESNTQVPWRNLARKEVKSVACGDCSVDVIIRQAKATVSRGVATDPVKGLALGLVASSQTTSQRTNTAFSSVSRFTNTRQAISMDSGANTVLRSQNKHTNTTKVAATRTASVGNRAKDVKCILKTRTVGVGTSPLEENVPQPNTRDFGVGFTSIHENFLVGLKTQNMASGPSHLPDPVKTRSIGVGEGKIRDLSGSNGAAGQQIASSQCNSEVDSRVEKIPAVLKSCSGPQTEGFAERKTSSSQSASNKDAPQGGPLDSVDREIQLPADSCKSCQQGGCDSEVKRMIQLLEQQTSSAVRDGSTPFGVPRKAMKKENGEQGCSNTRKNLRFMKAASGLNPPHKLPAADNPDEAPVDVTPARRLRGVIASKAAKGSAKSQITKRCKFSEKMMSACQALKTHLSDGKRLPSRELRDCLQTVQQEWFSVSSPKSASVESVEDYLSGFRVISPSLLRHVANMADGNGNTALHYSVSHSNFGVVQKLLDADVCDANKQNKAGYTPIMLAALAAVDRAEDMSVVEQLFNRGHVNAKAGQAGQTALMLAVSHGRVEMVRALLARGAVVNAQDDEGSTALMCASEHGHAAMVKLLLDQPDCDAELTDSDDSTALSIALEAGHNDIAVLLYAHANFSKGHSEAPHCGRS
ncbi:KN motif and ankyrin repeat domain-containing protein 1-like [Phyllopteryx taeniolatus]|uniref:KN motif and ankyrin repeat domain-containing protein 1-like n=1 Tax=Phyllopteryx taeniolatus TaxID=161469 RepID=UPI002AD3F22E|nr:KN motif and ankyrin repeat domain-containing protein 1-like [Phyllopteryx taeniolatus]